jgi:predicted nucleotidyltransferase
MVAMPRIHSLVSAIADRYHPQKIILFGSYADGTAGPDSDVDLLVLMQFEGKSFWKSLEILNWLNPDFPLDLLVRCPEDAARRYQMGDPLIREALDKGKVLYE